MTDRFSSIEALVGAINEKAPYKAGWPLNSRLDKETLRSFRFADKRRRSYRDFEIPKKSGGTRRITAPAGKLKDIQSCLADFLSELYVPNGNAMGFVSGRCILDNAREHLNKNYVLNIDLADFFPSIGATKVEASLAGLGVDALVAQLVSSVCSYPAVTDGHTRNVLPQGAPTSPVLSNIACMNMDRRLEGLARRFHLTYTRYADDITFSSNHNVYSDGGKFMTELRRIISQDGFQVNEKKTRLLKRGVRQEVTGLTVGEKVNVSRKWMKALRAAIFQMERSKPSYCDLQQVSGRLNYLGMIRGKDDPAFRKLFRRFKRVVYFCKRRTKSGNYTDSSAPPLSTPEIRTDNPATNGNPLFPGNESVSFWTESFDFAFPDASECSWPEEEELEEEDRNCGEEEPEECPDGFLRFEDIRGRGMSELERIFREVEEQINKENKR